MKTVTFFETREDLRELTGLSGDNHDEALWDAGFDLDDWDFGFVCNTEWSEEWGWGDGSFEVIGLSRGCCDNFANLWQLFWDQEVTDDPELYYCTVIGNIHDNPELMEDNNAK